MHDLNSSKWFPCRLSKSTKSATVQYYKACFYCPLVAIHVHVWLTHMLCCVTYFFVYFNITEIIIYKNEHLVVLKMCESSNWGHITKRKVFAEVINGVFFLIDFYTFNFFFHREEVPPGGHRKECSSSFTWLEQRFIKDTQRMHDLH